MLLGKSDETVKGGKGTKGCTYYLGVYANEVIKSPSLYFKPVSTNPN